MVDSTSGAHDDSFSDDDLLRYSRQMMLAGFDVAGQEKLCAAHVVVIGAGGLGSPVCLYLAAAGVGRLTIIDHDTVDISNLQRQIAHRTMDIGRAKAESAADAALAINPGTRIESVVAPADEPMLALLLRDAACVVDCCDNFSTRAAVNRACHTARVPLVSGAAIRMEGQLAVFDFRAFPTPCYACLYGADGGDDTTCARNGVMAPVVGVIGSLQALAAIRVITGYGESAHGNLSIFDGMRNEWRTLRIRADPACGVCGGA